MKQITVLVTNEFANEILAGMKRGAENISSDKCVLARVFRRHFSHPISVGSSEITVMGNSGGCAEISHNSHHIIREFDNALTNGIRYELPDTLVTIEAHEELLREIPEEVPNEVEVLEPA